MTAFQYPVRLGRCRERELMAEDGRRRPPVQQGRERPGAVAVVADEHAVEGDVGIQQRVQVQLRGGDRGDLPAGPQRGEGGGGQRAADQVGNGVHRPARQRLGPGGDILAGVVDARRSAQGGHLSVHGLAANAEDRKSTRLNSSHLGSSYAVFCWKKKNHRRVSGQDRQVQLKYYEEEARLRNLTAIQKVMRGLTTEIAK